MCVYIGIEDLVANALIELLNKDENKRFVSFQEVEQYGNAVVNVLKQENGEEAILLLSKYDTEKMFRDYSDFFEPAMDESGNRGIRLTDGKTAKDLSVQFRGYLAVDVLMAFIKKETVETLSA